MRFLLSVLWNFLNKLLQITQIHDNLAHFKAAKCLIQVFRLERAVILDYRLAEMLNL